MITGTQGWGRAGRMLAIVGAVGALALGAAGCSGAVAKDQVAAAVMGELQKKNITIDNNTVTCPEDLKAEVGQTARCTFTTDGQPVDVVAKVSSVSGSTVNYEISTEARPVAKAVLEKEVAKQVGQQSGATIDSTTCKGDLAPQVGQSVECTVTGGGETLDVKATVSKVDGGLVNFVIEAA